MSHLNEPASTATPLASDSTPDAPAYSWSGVLKRIGLGEVLTPGEVAWACEQIMSGEASDAQIAAFAFGIRVRGITADELAAAAETMRSFATPVAFPESLQSVDIVGTGGDGHHTVNISTMASFVVAACGVPVIKHANRAASSKSGGADMLEALGFPIERTPEQVRADAIETGFAFMFAKTYHPAMRFAAPARSQLGAPTLFNLLGPMTNPAQPPFGLIGCAFRDLMPTMAGGFAQEGTRTIVVRGEEGLDEISVCSSTELITVDGTTVSAVQRFDPRVIDVPFYGLDELGGGDATHNAAVARDLFEGNIEGAIKDAVLINAAGALAASRGWGANASAGSAAGSEVSAEFYAAMRSHYDLARETLESGQALRKLQEVIDRG